MTPEQKGRIAAWIIIIAMVIGFWYFLSDNDNPKPPISTQTQSSNYGYSAPARLNYQETKSTHKYTIGDAYIQSHSFVKDKLVSPGSADFPFLDGWKSEQINDTTFNVSGYVDSQNKFGALLRSDYTCIMIFYSDGRIGCRDLEIVER